MINATSQQEQTAARRACILHAEDDRLTSISIARLLTVKGFAVESAANGLEALTKLLSQPNGYDLIITDQSMPTMTGVEWLHGIRNAGFSGKIIVYASSLPGDMAQRFCELGVDQILSKTDRLQSLRDAIEELLKESSTRTGGVHGLEN